MGCQCGVAAALILARLCPILPGSAASRINLYHGAVLEPWVVRHRHHAAHYEDIAKQVLAPAQCPSALFEYLPHLSLNILGWFLCRKSSVSYRVSRVRAASAGTKPAHDPSVLTITEKAPTSKIGTPTHRS